MNKTEATEQLRQARVQLSLAKRAYLLAHGWKPVKGPVPSLWHAKTKRIARICATEKLSTNHAIEWQEGKAR